MSDKPDCYKCEHRGTVPGDAHSRCCYQGTNTDMFAFFDEGNKTLAIKLNIKAHEHGVRSGWFMWPVNFDPVWLTNCDGFREKNA